MMAKDKVVPPKPKYRGTSYLIDPDLIQGRPRWNPRRDLVEAELYADEADRAREIRDLRLEEIMARRKTKIARLKQELRKLEGAQEEGGGESAASEPSHISVGVARQLAKLSDDERQRVIETYAMLQGAESKNGASLLPLLVAYSRANPGATKNSMIEFAKVMGDQFSKGVDAGRSADRNTLDPYKPLEIVMTLIRDSVQKPLQEMAERTQPQPSAFEQILLDDRLFNRAKELGVFGGHSGVPRSDIDLEIERLRGERELQIEKLRLESRKMMLEYEAGERKTEALLSALTPMGALLAGPVEKKMRQIGRNTTTRTSSPRPEVQPKTDGTMPRVNRIRVACDCGYGGEVEVGDPIPPTLNCPSCGKELVIREQPEQPEMPPEAPATEEEEFIWDEKIHPQSYSRSQISGTEA